MQCGLCGRKLKDARSRERGFGPVCWGKVLKAKEEQETADEREDLA